jgi:ketosteroid isomerase-like protein
MQTEETRALIKTYYDTLPIGNREKLAALFTDDVEWYPPESAPLAVIKGRDAVTRELGGETPKRMFDMKTFRLTIHRILADGETAVVQHSISAKTRAGEQYENEYCWVYHCRDGKIAKIEEYADTHKAARIMKWEN